MRVILPYFYGFQTETELDDATAVSAKEEVDEKTEKTIKKEMVAMRKKMFKHEKNGISLGNFTHFFISCK